MLHICKKKLLFVFLVYVCPPQQEGHAAEHRYLKQGFEKNEA